MIQDSQAPGSQILVIKVSFSEPLLGQVPGAELWVAVFAEMPSEEVAKLEEGCGQCERCIQGSSHQDSSNRT